MVNVRPQGRLCEGELPLSKDTTHGANAQVCEHKLLINDE